MDNLPPKGGGVYLLDYRGGVGMNGILLAVGAVFRRRFHEFVVDTDADIRAGDFPFDHLGVDKVFGVRMFDRGREHQRTASATLGYFAGRIAVALHEGHKAGRSQRRVVDGRSFRTQRRQVVAYAATAFHELNLLFVDFEYGAVGIGFVIEADDEAVAQRYGLIGVADACHGAALRHDIAESVEKLEQFVVAERIGIFVLDSCEFCGDAVVHICRCFFEDVAFGVAEGILAGPHPRSE